MSLIRTRLSMGNFLVGVALVGALIFQTGCNRSRSTHAAINLLVGSVVNGDGDAVVGATVYLIPATAVVRTAFNAAEVLAGNFNTSDEPLEDLVDAAGPGTYRNAVTGANGSWGISVPLPLTGDYFLYVRPGAGDTVHVDGGSLCRTAISAESLAGSSRRIVLSGSPPVGATFVGTTTCLTAGCHADYVNEGRTAHRLGFSVPGQALGHQDKSLFPGFDDGLAYFTAANAYTDPGVTRIYFEDYDGTRKFDKFETYLNAAGGGVLYLSAYLWQDNATTNYMITLVNELNALDPNTPRHFVVNLTYGGGIYKQRYMIDINPTVDLTVRQGLYPFLQFQSAGKENYYERTRKVFRDYHADWHWDAGVDTVFGTGDDVFKDPAVTKTIEGNCLGCHSNGWQQTGPNAVGEFMCDSVEDAVNGIYDIDNDGTLNEINFGCETCHGPGSAHAVSQDAADIGCPDNYSPNRAVMICGRCHGRIKGWGSLPNAHPQDAADLFAPAGIRRTTYLTNYSQQNGPLVSKYHADGDHAKSHHQQYSELIRTGKHRNDRILVVCFDCHDVHGDTTYEHMLRDDPTDPNSTLCQNCHALDPSAHMLQQTGSVMGGQTTACVDCHMARTAKTGAGNYGFLLGAPTGLAADANIVYWENDIATHLFDVPDKFCPGVAGVTPGSAMPIPYTNACGICHDCSMIQYW